MKKKCFPIPLVFGLMIAATLALTGCTSTVPAPVEHGRTGTTVASPRSSDTYIVKSGDTLYSIAREHNMDPRELITLNRIENPNQISVGLLLKLKPSDTTASSDTVTTSPVKTESVVVKPIDAATDTSAAQTANTGALKREPKAGKLPYSEQALAQAQGAPSSSEAASGEKSAPQSTDKPAAQPTGPDEIAWIWPAQGQVVGTYDEKGNKGVDIANKEGEAVIAAAPGRVVYSGTGLRGYGKLVIIKHNNTYLSAYAHNKNILVKEGQQISQGQKIAEMGNTDADRVKLHFEVRRQGKPVDPLKYLPSR